MLGSAHIGMKTNFGEINVYLPCDLIQWQYKSVFMCLSPNVIDLMASTGDAWWYNAHFALHETWERPISQILTI
jgi:hypothetical protein